MKIAKSNLKPMWCRVCNEYVAELALMWGFRDYSNSWVGNDIGGVVCLNEELFVNMDDVRYCVDNNILFDEYDEWSSYMADAHEFSLHKINLDSWHRGCPRVSKEERDRLRNIKASLYEEINKINDKYGNKKQNC